MYRHGQILAPSPVAAPQRLLARPTARPAATGPIIDLYPGFDTPKPKQKTQPRASTRKPARPFPFVWLSAALMLAAIITMLVAFRGPIVESVPSLGSAYAAIGLPTADTNLQLQNVSVIGVFSRERITLSIQGEVANSTGRQFDVPAIELAIRGIDGRILSTMPLMPSRMTLDPGGIARFATQITDPPDGAHDITIRVGSGPAEPFEFM
jgi:hypothetical protein